MSPSEHPNPAAWGLPDFAFEPLAGGARSRVLRGTGAGSEYVFKTTTRSDSQLGWLSIARASLQGAGILAIGPERAKSGAWSVDGWTMERFVVCRAAVRDEATKLNAMVRRMHRMSHGIPQRPGFASSVQLVRDGIGGDVDLGVMPEDVAEQCRRAFAKVPSRPMTLVHGDLNSRNIGVTKTGQFVLFDWDEARVDHPLFDLVAIGSIRHPVPSRAAQAFEIATCWQREPDYAQALLKGFMPDW